jgi:osmotically-inducible protein OsmY
VPGWNFP